MVFKNNCRIKFQIKLCKKYVVFGQVRLGEARQRLALGLAAAHAPALTNTTQIPKLNLKPRKKYKLKKLLRQLQMLTAFMLACLFGWLFLIRQTQT
jgi:hypothetical protein